MDLNPFGIIMNRITTKGKKIMNSKELNNIYPPREKSSSGYEAACGLTHCYIIQYLCFYFNHATIYGIILPFVPAVYQEPNR
jgi:hypothetical protein